MRRLIGIGALLILVVAVFFVLRQPPRATIDATDQTVPATDTTFRAPSTAANTPPTRAVTDSSEPVTDNSTAVASVEPEDARAEFAITELQFGEDGFIAIVNVGNGPGSLAGYALCRRPQYFQIPDVELAPLETVWIAVGDGAGLGDGAGIAKAVIPMNNRMGSFGPEDGELALYRTSSFSDPEAMVTYVQWGSGGHGREEVAVEAGLWEPGAFLTVPADAFGIQSLAGTTRPAAGPVDWTAGVGG